MLAINRKKQFINRGVLYGAIVLIAGIYPFRAFALDTIPPDQPTQTTTPTPTDTTTTPTDSTTTTSPAVTTPTPPTPTAETQQTTTPTTTVEPKKNYYYDSKTGRWNTDEWKYDSTSGTYVAVPPPTMSIPEKTSPAGSSTTTIDSKTTAEISNALDSLAKTGDALVSANTSAGSATSGNASASATIINNVNSSMTNSNNAEAATFVSDVIGDVNGDIILQPMLLKAMLEAGATTATDSKTINSSNSTAITNDINLSAQSGDATVERNTSAGNATTGSANTVADVVNIVNSMVAANQSFIGTVNIYGNLNGDILIAPDFLPKLLASNSTVNDGGSVQVVNSKDTQSIVNNVALAANTGQAAVTGNTSAGSAKSGDAMTNVVLFNLSGHDIVASNSLLVFINVLGKWVGVIVDAPSGTTAAAIGNGVQKNDTTAPSLTINAINDTAITNNITLNSQSGDATVSRNTEAGNATTGNATASANIANITNSQIGLSGWFGVLFINVFGTWIGSFGIDTSAGNPVVANQPTSRGSAGNTANRQPLRVLSYVPTAGSSQPTVVTTIVTPTSVERQTQQDAAREVKAAQIFNPKNDVFSTLPTTHELDIPLAIGSLVITLTSLYLIRRFLF